MHFSVVRVTLSFRRLPGGFNQTGSDPGSQPGQPVFLVTPCLILGPVEEQRRQMWRAESPEGKDTEGSCLLATPAGQKSGLGGLWSLTGLWRVAL